MRIRNLIYFSLISLILISKANCQPWYTGPLLAPPGKTIPAGHNNFELYGSNTDNKGIFTRKNNIFQPPKSYSYQVNPLFTHGLSEYFDIQLSFPYTYNSKLNQHSSGLTDSTVILGYQALEQKNSLWRPNLRISFQYVIPIGKYQNLSPTKQGTDSRGLGSNRFRLGFNFQHLLHIYKESYLRTRLSLSHTFTDSVDIQGLNSFGGSLNTLGRIMPGSLTTVDLAGELSLTKNWVAVMEAVFSYRERTNFKGFSGTNANGSPATIGHGYISYTAIAPAIEYNFNEHVGVIGGVYLDVAGENAVKFISSMIAINIYY